MKPSRSRSSALLFTVLALAIIVVLWYSVIWAFRLKSFVMPTPYAAVRFLLDNRTMLTPMILATLKETLIGFLAGTAFGFVCAVAMSQSPIVQRLIYPMLITSQAIPVVAVAPPLVILLGFGLTPKLVIVGWIVFFPVLVSVLDGLLGVDRDILSLANSMRGSRRRTFVLLRLPAAIGPLFSGLKIGATYAVTGAVIGEWTASNGQGLGAYIQNADAALNAAGVYGSTMLLTIIGVAGFVGISRLERVAAPWKYRSVARGGGWLSTKAVGLYQQTVRATQATP